MKFLALLLIAFTPFLASSSQAKQTDSEKLGVRWLKDKDSPAVRQWVLEQNGKARRFLTETADGQPDPLYAQISERAKELNPTNPAPAVTTPHGRVFIKAGSLVVVDQAGSERVLAAKVTHPDGTGSSAVAEFKISPDFTKVGYSFVKNGTDANDWHVIGLPNGEKVAGPFSVRLADFSWSIDSTHIYYSKWPSADEIAKGNAKTRNFKVSLQTILEEFVFEPPQKASREFYAMTDFDFSGKRYLLAYRTQGSAEVPMAVYVRKEGSGAWLPIRHPLRSRLGRFIGVEGSKVYLRSSEAGNNFGIVSVDIAQGMKTEVVVPKRKNQVLISAQRAGDRLFLQYFDMRSFAWRLELADLSGQVLRSFQLSDVGLPNNGSVTLPVISNFTNELEFTFNDVHVPTKTLVLNYGNQTLSVKPDSAPVAFDSSKVKRELKWIRSLDGTSVPIDLYSRVDGVSPKFAYIFYYGYIGVAQFGTWNKKLELALELGGTVAIVHQRGGGELGRDWQMGVKADRLASLQDTVATARWLKNTAGVGKVLATGRSFGGMHTMALQTKFTDEFDAFIPIVGISDANEFLNEGAFGYYAVDDFGIPRDEIGNLQDTAAWRAQISAWSPLANLSQMKTLKPTMIFTADHDERAGPEHSFYFAEALNKKFAGNSQVHIYTEINNGHAAKTETADEAAFIARTFGIRTLQLLK